MVATKSQSVILSGEGAVTQRLGPVLTLTPTQDHLVAWGPTEAQVIARDGAIISRWDLPALTLSQQDRPAVPVPHKACCCSATTGRSRSEKMPADLDSAGGSGMLASPGSSTSSDGSALTGSATAAAGGDLPDSRPVSTGRRWSIRSSKADCVI